MSKGCPKGQIQNGKFIFWTRGCQFHRPPHLMCSNISYLRLNILLHFLIMEQVMKDEINLAKFFTRLLSWSSFTYINDLYSTYANFTLAESGVKIEEDDSRIMVYTKAGNRQNCQNNSLHFSQQYKKNSNFSEIEGLPLEFLQIIYFRKYI